MDITRALTDIKWPRREDDKVKNKKEKLSLYRPVQAPRVPGG
jgi:hypothetical protein